MQLVRIMDYQHPHHPLEMEPTMPFARVRQAARAVVTDSAGGVYLMYSARDTYYKLPGGGVDAGETFEVALHREIREEMGARIRVTGEVGRVIQFDEGEGFRQDSYCYTAQLIGQLGQPQLTREEAAAGFRVERFEGHETAMAALDRGAHDPLHASMAVRDRALLAAAYVLGYNRPV